MNQTAAAINFDPSTADFPADISNSGGSAAAGREAFIACHTKWINHHIRKLEKPTNIHLHAGASFAKGMEVARRTFFRDGGTQEDARIAGNIALREHYGDDYAELWAQEVKSRNGMLGALNSYLERWPFASDFLTPFEDSTKGVEFDFAIPLPIAHPQTGEPIPYRGRIDWLARSRSDGQVWIVDDKTTSSLGPSWRKQWALDSQPTGYVYCARQFGIPAAGVLLRGTSILKKGFGHEETIEPRTSFAIEDWFAQLCQDVQDMIDVWQDFRAGRRVRKRLDKANCNAYGGCAYLQSCQSPNPEQYFRPPADPLTAPSPVDLDDLFKDL